MKDLHITKWEELARKLKAVKQEEADLRREICEELIKGHEMVNGIATAKEAIEGFQVTAKQSLGYTIDVAALGALWKELSECEQACVTMKPTLALSAYKRLPEDSLLHEAIVTRLSMPTLKAEAIGI